MSSKAQTVEADLAELPDDRRAVVTSVRKVIAKHLHMGKSCVRFKRAEGLPLPTIGRLVAAVPVDTFIARYEASRKK